jgi:hypothetical protein
MAQRLLVQLLVIGVVLLATSGVARAQVDEQGELDKGRNAYLAHQYDQADGRFHDMLDTKNGTLRDKVLVNQARMYWAAVKLAKNQPDAANDLFEELLLSDATFNPDPLAFPTDVVNAFIDARARLRKKIEAIERDKARREAERKTREEKERAEQLEYTRRIERMAKEEKTVEVHSRWLALLPFGIGQFQNGQKVLGWVFLGTEAALLAAAAITVPVYLAQLQARTDANAQGLQSQANQYIARAENVRTANIILNASFGTVWLLGVAQSELAFVHEDAIVTTRPLPKPASPPSDKAPSVSWSVLPILPVEGKGGGLSVGVVGRF